ncbi:sigma factor-like helix-turn-helix DNA-binding protein [Streptomyces sp. NPDC087844]|uniref:sigma factor-like helix-turn-helix DNA-binding protein n=1 Tax=Streptomyces sp. NPDC087844 TaxID=3365805 RepID=UPI00382AFA8B
MTPPASSRAASRVSTAPRSHRRSTPPTPRDGACPAGPRAAGPRAPCRNPCGSPGALPQAGRTAAEAAVRLGVPEGTVKSRAHHALKASEGV